ncbi:ankyrin repeat-containing protein NPR4-like isoform X2 [Neltuma alba]|uniref:ankyrin repeat-containing protein NPR4-like isoform X2 n=1 Tax=Neltuma alba TaxID=207710 RepID=UPI0010A3F344|nr:ankyrin repeat-containing protein NPR4-like isoform X2 [Prosopis alba]
MAETCVYNGKVIKPLTKENSREWFNLVKNYLIAHRLWGVMIDDAATHQDDPSWRQKNEEALRILRISCSPQTLHLIEVVPEAKAAWRLLHHNFAPKPSAAMNAAGETSFDVGILHKAICANKLEEAKQILEQHSSAWTAKLTATNGTPLHVAALFGHVELVKELVRLADSEFLEIVDDYGSTPLAIAASTGVVEIAKCMLNKNRNILDTPDLRYHLPVALAIGAGQKEMGRFLYKETPLEVLKPQNGYLGSRLLRACFEAGELDIARHLLEQCEDIIFAADHTNWTPIASIASMPAAVESVSQLGFWKRWIYKWHGLLHWFISNTYNRLGVKEIYELKLLHERASQILKLLCQRAPLLDRQQHGIVINTLYIAAREGLVDFLSEVSKTNPQLIQFTSSLGNRNTFFCAVECRQAEVFNLIHEYRFKNLIASVVDTSGHCMMHMAAMLGPSNQLNRVSGAALQMQREMQWFKEVEKVVPLGLRVPKNSKGKRPKEMFIESHKALRDAGEKWMKDTASSCSVVGALIVTIMFAAAFTVPGGNDQNTGYPMFLKDKLFILFMISDALSLFSSTTSVLTFLGVFTSRYAEEDFLISLPRKLIIGLSALFLSILTMMAAFCLCIILMFKHTYSWSYLPVIIIASVPVTLFVLLQFPLLLDVISSTYGPGIFKRNVK